MMAGLSVQPSSLWTMNGSSSGVQGAVGEHADRAVALAGDAFGEKLLHQAGEAVVVITLAQPVVEAHVERVVDLLQAAFGNLDALPPDREVFRVAGLEFHQLGLAGFQHRRDPPWRRR